MSNMNEVIVDVSVSYSDDSENGKEFVYGKRIGEIVRCKDCRWGKEACGNIECNVDSNLPSEYHGYEWFCPNGEMKDNDRH